MWIAVAKISDLNEGESVLVEISGKAVALFFTPKGYFAFDNACPHQGGPLVEGSIENGEVTCPWHAWSFDVRSGACASLPGETLQIYPVKTEDGKIWIQV